MIFKRITKRDHPNYTVIVEGEEDRHSNVFKGIFENNKHKVETEEQFYK